MKLHTKFMRGIVSKLVRNIICKKTGYKADIQFNEIDIKNEGGKIQVHINVDGEMTTEEFAKVIKKHAPAWPVHVSFLSTG